MQGFAFNTTIVIIASLSAVFLNSQTFAGTSTAGCMGCHQGGVVSTDGTADDTQQLQPHQDQRPATESDTSDAIAD